MIEIADQNASVLPDWELFLAKETSLVIRSSLSSTDFVTFATEFVTFALWSIRHGKV